MNIGAFLEDQRVAVDTRQMRIEDARRQLHELEDRKLQLAGLIDEMQEHVSKAEWAVRRLARAILWLGKGIQYQPIRSPNGTGYPYEEQIVACFADAMIRPFSTSGTARRMEMRITEWRGKTIDYPSPSRFGTNDENKLARDFAHLETGARAMLADYTAEVWLEKAGVEVGVDTKLEDMLTWSIHTVPKIGYGWDRNQSVRSSEAVWRASFGGFVLAEMKDTWRIADARSDAADPAHAGYSNELHRTGRMDIGAEEAAADREGRLREWAESILPEAKPILLRQIGCL